MYDFLRVDDQSSPLYGRHLEEVRVNKFDSKKSLDFLEKGFQQVDMEVQEEVLKYATEKLDGIVGWLTEFGHRCFKVKEVKRSIVDDILELAMKTTVDELSHFSKEYVYVIEAIARGYERWSEIKRYIEEKEKMVIHDAELRRHLRTLEKRG
ncbi:ATP-binding protein [Sulfuracidifex tepidarius]|uniref:ATP-binding protein n=1 Tax=Sulfuracidifex tepidarius TaxID=1294262 RepID=UPI0011F149FE|nr:ATP-binding protein [Sulfuracidifex tepidarius]